MYTAEQASVVGATPPVKGRGRRVVALAAAGVLVVTIGAAAVLASRPSATTGSSQATTSGEPARQRSTPEAMLTDAAARLLATPPPEASGRYIHIAIERWGSDGGGNIKPVREQRWTDPATRRTHTIEHKLPAVNLTSFNPSMVGHTDFTAVEEPDVAESTTPADAVRPSPPADAEAMLRELARDNAGYGAVAAVEYVVGVHWDTHPSPAARVAALTMLARIEGLTVEAATADPLGRCGIAITARDAARTVTLIIDPGDGLALAFTQQANSTSDMAMHEHAIMLANTRTDTITPAGPSELRGAPQTVPNCPTP